MLQLGRDIDGHLRITLSCSFLLFNWTARPMRNSSCMDLLWSVRDINSCGEPENRSDGSLSGAAQQPVLLASPTPGP